MDLYNPEVLLIWLGGSFAFSILFGRGAGIAFFLIYFLIASGYVVFGGSL